MWRSFKKLKIELAYDTAIPLLGLYLEKNMVWKDTCMPMFIAELFTIAKMWKQPKCPSIEEWIRMMCYIHTMEYHSSIKNNEIMPLTASHMDGHRHRHTEWSETDWEISCDIPHTQNLKRNDTNELLHKIETDWDLETKLILTRRKGRGEGTVMEFGINIDTLL